MRSRAIEFLSLSCKHSLFSRRSLFLPPPLSAALPPLYAGRSSSTGIRPRCPLFRRFLTALCRALTPAI
ncbi:hypothetical protein GCWU000341_02131 [Oribacterium sp. oral taxon 078 str. F0262]|nr:hypothetical protein GCWU000341_02131 [Oribacterium sp. oral taxon 078 str. F0262]